VGTEDAIVRTRAGDAVCIVNVQLLSDTRPGQVATDPYMQEGWTGREPVPATQNDDADLPVQTDGPWAPNAANRDRQGDLTVRL
jgi:hypothetical protein